MLFCFYDVQELRLSSSPHATPILQGLEPLGDGEWPAYRSAALDDWSGGQRAAEAAAVRAGGSGLPDARSETAFLRGLLQQVRRWCGRNCVVADEAIEDMYR